MTDDRFRCICDPDDLFDSPSPIPRAVDACPAHRARYFAQNFVYDEAEAQQVWVEEHARFLPGGYKCLEPLEPRRDHICRLRPVKDRACCDWHNQHCEPPSELCCHDCPEAAHDTFPIRHADGSGCMLDRPEESR